MSEFAPGPWSHRLGQRPGGRLVYSGEQGSFERVAVCHSRDADLIAAAPELFEALNCLIEHPDIVVIPDGLLDRASLALMKARGENPNGGGE